MNAKRERQLSLIKTSVKEVERICEKDALDMFLNINDTNVRFKLRDFDLKVVVFNALTCTREPLYKFHVKVTHRNSGKCLFLFLFSYEQKARAGRFLPGGYIEHSQESVTDLFPLRHVVMYDRCRYVNPFKNIYCSTTFITKKEIQEYLSKPSEKQEILMALVRLRKVTLPSELLMKLMYDFL